MAPLMVISNAYCYTGAPQCFNAGSYYSHGRYPDARQGGGAYSLCRHCFTRQSFHALHYYQVFLCGFNKAVVLYIHSAAINILSLI